MTPRLVITLVGIVVVLLLIGMLLSNMGHFVGIPWPLIVCAGAALLFVFAFTLPLIRASESSAIEVAVPPQVLWDALHEVSYRAAWYPEVRNVSVTLSGAGPTSQAVRLGLSRGAVLNVTQVESVAPQRKVFRVTGPGIRSILRQELEPSPTGTLYRSSDTLRLSVIAALVRVLGARGIRARRTARMERIKRDVEGAAAGPARGVSSS